MDDLHELQEISVWLPIAAATLTGGVIGFERQLQAKAAGVRTHTLVCLASAVLMLAAAQQTDWSFETLPDATIVADPTRMAHGILTGIGFLCAGVIFRQGTATHGLTTAASLWMTSAIGVLYGAGLLWLGLAASVATLLILVALRALLYVMPDWAEVTLHLTIDRPTPESEAEVTRVIAHHIGRAPLPATRYDSGGADVAPALHLAATLWMRDASGCAALRDALQRIAGVSRVSLSPSPLIQPDPFR